MAAPDRRPASPLAAWLEHLRNAPLRRGFAIGFCILFAFIGTFTYVNFVLVRAAAGGRHDGARLRLFRLPAVDRHHAARRPGRRAASAPGRPSGLRSRVAGAGLPLLLTPSLPPCSSAWPWSASAPSSPRPPPPASSAAPPPPTAARRAASISPATSSAAWSARAVLGQVFDRLGWPACVAGVGLALGAAAWLAGRLNMAPQHTTAPSA